MFLTAKLSPFVVLLKNVFSDLGSGGTGIFV